MKIKTCLLIFLSGLSPASGVVLESRPTDVDDLAAKEIASALAQTLKAARPPRSQEKTEELVIRGQVMIEAAYKQLEERHWAEGLRMLRIGLAWNPRDKQARMRVAGLQWIVGSYAAARLTAYDELPHGYPGRKYMEYLLQLARWGEEPEGQLELLALVLDEGGSMPREDRAWLLRERALTLISAERWADALAFVKAYSDEMEASEWRELGFNALCGARRFDEAEVWLNEWRAKSGPSPQVLRFYARAYREAGRLVEMDTMLKELVRRNPSDPATRSFSIIQRLLAGMVDDASRELDGYLLRFGADQNSLRLLARPLAEIEREPELLRIEAAAAEQGLKDPAIATGHFGLFIKQARWDEAAAMLAKIRRDFPAEAAVDAHRLKPLECFLRVARTSDAEGPSALLDAMKFPVQSLGSYQRFIKALRTAGRPEAARLLAEQGLAIYGDSRSLRAALNELAADGDGAGKN